MFEKAKFLLTERAKVFKKGVARNRDVLFAHNATVGPVAMLNTTLSYVILSTTLTYYRCNPDKLLPEYLYYYMQTNFFEQQYKKVMGQTTRNQIPITAQRKLLHILPNLDDQKNIVRILSGIDCKIDTAKSLKTNYLQLKLGLMSDLLSGKVRQDQIIISWILNNLVGIIGIIVGGFIAYHVYFLSKKLDLKDKLAHKDEIRKEVEPILQKIRRGINSKCELVNVKKYLTHYPHTNDENRHGYTYFGGELKALRFDGS